MIQVIHRAIDILEFVARDPERPKLLGEISAGINLKPGTCANIVKTLTLRGYLEKLDAQKGYLPGKQLYTLLGNTGYKKDLIEAADLEMEILTAKLNENTLLAVLNGENRVVIHRKQSNQLVQAHTPDEKKAYDSSTGRLLIAMLPDEELEKFIARFGLPPSQLWHDANTQRKFYQQVEQIRDKGYALIEDSVQIIGLAVPVYRNDAMVASLSIYMPAFRCTDKIRNRMIKLCMEAAKKISKNLN
ncbi:MAG: IclR family transcriptional regulator [Bacteroidetes bacterium]|nr:IclR family transcriptional regulator [Bacteroidota bacterium]